MQVEVSKLDVADMEEAKGVIALAQKQAPVGGIFHLAMILQDRWMANQVSTLSLAAVHPKHYVLLMLIPHMALHACNRSMAAERCGAAANSCPAGVQTGESWNAPIIPKAYGALNLDALSDSLPHLEQFVIFSSVVSSTGNEGESMPPNCHEALSMLMP